jgi:hypothetical protein
MKKLLRILPVLIAFMLTNYAFASQFGGPLEVKNQFPIFLPINQPYLEQAATESSLPILRATAGFLDQLLATYHRTFGFADYGRCTRPYNSFLYNVERNGAPVVIGENNRTGYGDARLMLKRAITTSDPRISVAATHILEFPK